MLLNGSQLVGTPVMSLQTGKELATASKPIVNPHNLSVIAYHVAGSHLDHDPSYLRVADIRELGNLGMIVDSSDEFIEPDDIIIEKNIYDLDYTLEGKHVIDEQNKKIGKVIDYVIDIESFVIQQLIVKRPLLRSFTDDELRVHRSQIVEVTDDTIMIKSAKGKVKEAIKPGHYVNPFRQNTPQAETARLDQNK